MSRSARTGRILVGVAIPLGLVGLVAIAYLVGYDDLPEQVATHFDASGEPDGTMGRAGLFSLVGLLTVGCAAATAIVGWWRRPLPPGVGPTLAGAAAFIGATMAGILFVTIASHDGIADWRDAPGPSALQLVALIGGSTLVGAGTAWAASRLPARSDPAPEDAPALALGPSERVTWAGRARAGWVLGLVAASVAVTGVLVWSGIWIASLSTLIVGLLAMVFSSVRVVADHRGLSARLGVFGWPRVSVDLDEVRVASVVDVEPLRWGGWGYRGSLRLFRRAAIVIRRGPAIRLDLSGGRVLVVTVDDAETGVAVLNGELRRRAASSAPYTAGP